MMSLLANLQGMPGASSIWFLPDKGYITVDALHSFLIHYATKLEPFACTKVALKSQDQGFLAIFLVALDGLCGEILLIPEGTPDDRATELLAIHEVDYVLEYCNEVVTVRHDGHTENMFFDVKLLWAGATGHNSEEKRRLAASRLNETAWVIPTSGTTGTPKLVRHSLRTLSRTVRKKSTGQHEYRWGLLYSLTRFAGLQVFLQAILGGSVLILSNQNDPLESRLRVILQGGCNALSATPTMWRKILMTGLCDGANFRQITLGGEIVDQQILSALARQFPEARLTHIYASTEAGAGFTVTDCMAGFPAAYLDNPPYSTSVRVEPDGRLLLRPASPFQEYVGGKRVFDDEGWVDTGDLVKKESGRFFFLGRVNGCINVGGNKVHPEEVEQVLRAFPGIVDARVCGRKNPFTGFLVVADIIRDKESAEAHDVEKAIIIHCRQWLESYKVPAVINIVDSFTVSGSGKLERG